MPPQHIWSYIYKSDNDKQAVHTSTTTEESQAIQQSMWTNVMLIYMYMFINQPPPKNQNFSPREEHIPGSHIHLLFITLLYANFLASIYMYMYSTYAVNETLYVYNFTTSFTVGV